MKIIHCADIHLDSKLSSNYDGDKKKRRKEEILRNFINMTEYAAGNCVEAIIIAGDLFDTSNITQSTANAVRRCIRENPDITFFYLKGNHDVYSFLCDTDKYDNLKMFGEEWTAYTIGANNNIVITGAEITSENSRYLFNSLVLEADKYNIVTLHGQNAESSSKDKTEIIDFGSLKNKSIDYLALGHVHKYSCGRLDQRGEYCYPGCLEGRGFDECGEHGFVELDIDEDTLKCERRFVNFCIRKIYEVEVDASECSDSTEAIRAIRRCLNETKVTSEDIVKIVLIGEIDEEAEIDIDYIRDNLWDEYYLIKIYDKTQIRIDYRRYEADISLKGEFIRLVMGDDSLDPEEKAAIIRTGIRAIAGEEY